MDISSEATAAIYAWYSPSLHMSFVTFNMSYNNGLVSAHKEYKLSKNRALLAGLIEIVLTKFNTDTRIILYTDTLAFKRSFDNPSTAKYKDLAVLMEKAKPNVPNLKVEFIDDNLLLTKCKKDAIKQLKNKSLAKQMLKELDFKLFPTYNREG